MRKLTYILLVVCTVWSSLLFGQSVSFGAPVKMAGLLDSAEVIRDTNGIAHIRAANEHDLIFLQGYTHAEDRFFQMDYLRHVGSGTFAEMVGTAALAQDVQLRTLGLRRAAQRNLLTLSPRMASMIQAYSEGVNAYISTHPLPPEYALLGITEVTPWQPLDTLTVAKLLTYQLNFNTTDIAHTIALASYQAAGKAMGFDGTKLFFEDLFRSAPFERTITIADHAAQTTMASTHGKSQPILSLRDVDADTAKLSKRYLSEIDELPFFKRFENADSNGGSNGWAVSGQFSASGAPLLANDPHINLDFPSIWYPIHLAAGELEVTGQSFPGAPLVVVGHNRWISWGTTATIADVMDYYREQVVPDGTSPSGLSTLYKGRPEHVIPVPETYRARMGGQIVTIPSGGSIPAASLVLPRRNNGPIMQFDTATGSAISMQWTGFSPTTELEAVLAWAEARDPADFERGVRLFTIPQNFLYVDRKGNVGYYMSGDIPIREDLQAGVVEGTPPNVLRNGQGGNEWMPIAHRQPYQAVPYEIIPESEMPKVLNPPAGWVENANNDAIGLTLDNSPFTKTRPGGGIFYISYQFNAGFRAARISEMLRAKIDGSEKFTLDDMQKIQADTVVTDARFFVPYLTQALANSKRQNAAAQLFVLANDAGVQEAVGRLAAWDFTSPSGISNGFDAFDLVGQSNPRTSAQIANSAATTIYTLWRARFIQTVIDAKLTPYGLPVPDGNRPLTALRNMLETFDTNHGVGASGVDFFSAPGIASASNRRDLYILQSLKSALDLLASDNFKKAFGNSTNQSDYRWGKLNRLIMQHPLGPAFNMPSAGELFLSPLAGLEGFPLDGAFQSVDPASDSLRGKDENGYVFRFGPSERSIAEALPSGVNGRSSLAGGVSAVMTSPGYFNLLPQYLTNGTYEQFFGMDELHGSMQSVVKYEP